MLQLFLFLMQQEMNQVDYAIGLNTEIVCDFLIQSLTEIIKKNDNPIEKSIIIYSIFNSRIERYIKNLLNYIFTDYRSFTAFCVTI